MADAKDDAPRILVVEDENVVALDIQRDLIEFWLHRACHRLQRRGSD